MPEKKIGSEDIITTTTSTSDGLIKFTITGFGPFGGVQRNPSTILVEELKEYLVQTESEELATYIEQTFVLETSAQAVREAVDEMAKASCNGGKRIYLHLGVNYKGTGFQLEQCAYNDASFRIPDQLGYQPKDTVILDQIDLAARCDTTLDLAFVAKNQTMLHADMETKLSTNPGRFVCNYLYCYSLNNLQTKSTTCMFLHVPPFERIGKESQLEYIADLMRALINARNQS